MTNRIPKDSNLKKNDDKGIKKNIFSLLSHIYLFVKSVKFTSSKSKLCFSQKYQNSTHDK